MHLEYIWEDNMKSLTINLMVKDVNESIKFYIDLLEFKKVMSVPEEGIYNWAMISHGDVSIMFQEEKNIKEEYSCIKNNDITPSFTMYIRTDNVKKLYDEIKSKAVIALDYHKTFYGSYEFAICDNNGYVITFTE